MKAIGEALREMEPHFRPVGVQRKPLLDALGGVSAEDIVATRDLPGFDNSAMDGYAVRHRDLQQLSEPLAVQGEVRAGAPAREPLGERSAYRIFTGGQLPEGADTVVIQEHCQRLDGRVRIEQAPRSGQHIRSRGSDLRRGDRVLGRGAVIGPGEIGLLAATGVHTVSVWRTPCVAIISTGDELRDIGQDDAPGTIVNSNAYALAAQVLEAGAQPWILPSAPDDRAAIVACLRSALRADLVLSVGGVSVGEYDLVAGAFAEAGVDTHFWKVAIKPGKPLMFGSAAGTPVVGLPGNPVSAMITFEVFVRPGLRRMLDDREPYVQPIEVELATPYIHSTGRTELARATLERNNERVLARLHQLQGSGSLPSMCGVDALVVFDTAIERFEAGQLVPALPLGRRRGTSTPPF